MTANRSASIRARLKQHPDTSKQDFNLTLTQYAVRPGAPAVPAAHLRARTELPAQGRPALSALVRPAASRDADLLGFGPDDVPTIVGVFRSVCGIAVDYGIVFDPASVTGTEIRKDAGYGGVRIDLRATLDGARVALQVDIGFGDAVTPEAQPITYPTLLTDVPAPRTASSLLCVAPYFKADSGERSRTARARSEDDTARIPQDLSTTDK